ncbi:hypothetical protein F383_30856 [Gossypium arboreum]|uniref:Uncharacterized protein n=1 Tax=Gossypium arboreum TaxID=29729 RepID=A0A0B0N2K1_GOSAR|nr:hypothetical protein F383_30856 [Gossypium arboreum]
MRHYKYRLLLLFWIHSEEVLRT